MVYVLNSLAYILRNGIVGSVIESANVGIY